MACFLVPAAEAAVTTVAERVIHSRERNASSAAEGTAAAAKLSVSHHLRRLNTLLWGGSALLCFEHIWHGEIVPFFPFLTAAADPQAMAEVFSEMSASGVAMALVCTGAWGVITAVSCAADRKTRQDAQAQHNAETEGAS